ncbi:hypothetical protein HJC23_007912 [Cyclotella cryptica]|uniref:Peroxisomal membrane protein PEX16 n=1 Tax=Cyclotella cryptica TaxID=29204 RepID=A0ABD3NZM9_9STRA
MLPSSQLCATTSGSLAAASPLIHRRGDPLDIPLIDNHLAVQLLFPRIITSIRWVLPKLYLDWTTLNNSRNRLVMDNPTGNGWSHDLNGVKNPELWKRIVEIILHASLLLGSSRFVQGRGKDGCYRSKFWIRTPAMKNLGLFLSPTRMSTINFNQSMQRAGKTERNWRLVAIRSRIFMYFKLVMLIAVTVVGPRLHEEVKDMRQQQLRDRERRQRSRDMQLVPRNDVDSNQQQQSHFFQSMRERERATIDRRAKDRKSRLQALVIDAILGTAEMFIPPLRLINYLSYLWGLSSTPDLGMRLIGLDYAPCADSSLSSSFTDFGGNFHRHANFHYGNRRLLVEEALRTASAVIPPRGNETTAFATSARRPHNQNDGTDVSAQNNASGAVHRNSVRTGSWLRKRALSALGVIEEKIRKTQNTSA